MRERFGAEHATASPNARQAIAQIDALLRREPSDLAGLVLDMTGVPDLNQRVYAIARRIAPGRTLTYGEIARRLGGVGLSRAVGQALGRNPFAIIVPCHRVLSANGLPGGFSAPGGVTVKRQLLALEGYVLSEEPPAQERLWTS